MYWLCAKYDICCCLEITLLLFHLTSSTHPPRMTVTRRCLCCVKYLMFIFNLIFWVSFTSGLLNAPNLLVYNVSFIWLICSKLSNQSLSNQSLLWCSTHVRRELPCVIDCWVNVPVCLWCSWEDVACLVWGSGCPSNRPRSPLSLCPFPRSLLPICCWSLGASPW